jgi:nicotinate phosphoribosyltransferase
MRFPPLAAVRERARAGIAALHPTIRRFLNPHVYPVGLERGLHLARASAIEAARRL